MDSEIISDARVKGGRPSRAEAERLEEKILKVATGLFVEQGFAATSIEAVARGAGVAKRTLYVRYADKAALYVAVIRRLMRQWLETVEETVPPDAEVAEVLCALGRSLLAAITRPEVIALHRVMYAEGPRFPDMARLVHELCADHGWRTIAEILERETARGRLTITDPLFTAQQFYHLIVAEPLDRLLGAHPHPFTTVDGEDWVRRSVALFLNGTRAFGDQGFALDPPGA
ncbi:TetR/AcrR family transcriptional regulator, mexJK operon transcriptional repressor [uncultured Gammaproteobacteria bacterium]